MWRKMIIALGAIASFLLALWRKYRSKEAEIEKLAEKIEDLKAKANEANKKWRAAVSSRSPNNGDIHGCFIEWERLSTELGRAERKYLRLTGKAADIH